MERDTELAANQFGDPAGRPEVGREAVGGRLLGEPTPDLSVLIRGQEPRTSRRRLGREPGVAVGAVPGHPLGHSDDVDAERLGHGHLRPAAEDSLHGSSACRFQRGSRSVASHGAQDSRRPKT